MVFGRIYTSKAVKELKEHFLVTPLYTYVCYVLYKNILTGQLSKVTSHFDSAFS